MAESNRGPCINCWNWDPETETYGKCWASYIGKDGKEKTVGGRGKPAIQFCNEENDEGIPLYNPKARVN